MLKILVIRFSSLGDLVLSTPVYREIKRVYASSHLTLLTSQGFGEVLANNPHCDQILYHPRKERFSELQALIQKLKQQQFDLVYDAHGSLRSRWIVWNLKPEAVWRINKRVWQRFLLMNFKLKGFRINLLSHTLSQREYFLEALQKHTSIALASYTELFPSKSDFKKIQQLMEEYGLQDQRFVCIAASASFPLKCWPLEYYQEVVETLLKENWRVVLVGGKSEPETLELLKHFENKAARRGNLSEVVSFAGKLSFLESAALLKFATLTLGNDTSVGHIAEAMGTPALCIFGPTTQEFGYAPFLKESRLLETSLNLPCRPCTRNGKGKCHLGASHICMTSLSARTVQGHLLRKLN